METVNVIIEIVDKFGVAFGMLLYFIYKDYKTQEIFNAFRKSIDKNTKALSDVNKVLDKVCDMLHIDKTEV